jgi:hypothetical protein
MGGDLLSQVSQIARITLKAIASGYHSSRSTLTGLIKVVRNTFIPTVANATVKRNLDNVVEILFDNVSQWCWSNRIKISFPFIFIPELTTVNVPGI